MTPCGKNLSVDKYFSAYSIIVPGYNGLDRPGPSFTTVDKVISAQLEKIACRYYCIATHYSY